MALLRIRQLRLILTNPNIHRLFSDKVITLEIDPHDDDIDSFTSALVQKNSNKWLHLKLKKKHTIRENHNNLLVQKTLFTDITTFNKEELSDAFSNALDGNDKVNIDNLIDQCIHKKCCPSVMVVLKLFDGFSRDGNVEMINKTRAWIKDTNVGVYSSNGEFNHYLAEATWIKGDVIKALDLFEASYRKNVYLRRRIRLMLRYLILDLTQRSEAILVNIIKFSESILKEHNDFYPLVCVWQACFLSEWFTDQNLALELLERNNGLCKAVINNIPYVVWVSLRGHQTEVIYRLLEVLLKYDMKMQYSIVLIALFEYRFRQGDLKSCSEIIQWSITHKVMLPTDLHERFLMLLLNRSDVNKEKETKRPPDYNYKF